MKEMMLAIAFVTLSAGTAFAGGEGDHGADRLLNQPLLHSMLMVRSDDKPLAERCIAGGGKCSDGVAHRESR